MKNISPESAQIAGDALFLDVRSPLEFEQLHVPGAVLHPLPDLQPHKVAEIAADRPVIVFCRTGNRARKAAEQLSRAGVKDISVVEGGLESWEAANLPVVRGRKGISLERQVRIAAGALILCGVALGAALHPGFFAIAGLVGAGLIFAGVTDWCGMGMLLARMPWNQRHGAVDACAVQPRAQS